MNHDELRDSIPALALNALPKGEQVLVETHVSVCAGCSFEYRQYQEVAALLAHLTPAINPPPSLWTRIEDEVAEEGVAGENPPGRAVAVAAFTPATPVAPNGTRRSAGRPRRFSMQRIAALGAAALLIAGGVSLPLLRHSDEREPGRSPRDDRALYQAIISSPHAQITMRPTDLAPGVSGEIFAAADGKVAVAIHGLPSPGSQTYAMWLKPTEGPPLPLGDFRPDASGEAKMATARTVGHSPRLVVTLEGRAGNTSPTGSPVLNS